MKNDVNKLYLKIELEKKIVKTPSSCMEYFPRNSNTKRCIIYQKKNAPFNEGFRYKKFEY